MLDAIAGTYEGLLAGKYALRLTLGLQANANEPPFQGVYYYTSRGYLISLRATPLTDSLIIAEHGAGLAKAPTALFHLGATAGGGWAGTWRTADGRRRLPATLWRYDGAAPAGNCRPRISTRTRSSEFAELVITTADAGVTRLLHDYFSVDVSPEEPQSSDLGQGPAGSTSVHYQVMHQDDCLLSVARTSEFHGAANFISSTRVQTLDLRTGFELLPAEQIQPDQLPVLVAECNRRLARQVEDFIREQAITDPIDQEGLRARRFTVDDLYELALTPGGIEFPVEVEYDMMTDFMRKLYHRSFGPVFTLAELRPYLRPDSPLLRFGRGGPRR